MTYKALEIAYPTVHLNGSPKALLLENYRNAIDALFDAIEAVQKTSPHGRDYYVIGDGVFGQAAREHADRLQRLAAVKRELNALALHVSDQ